MTNTAAANVFTYLRRISLPIDVTRHQQSVYARNAIRGCLRGIDSPAYINVTAFLRNVCSAVNDSCGNR